MYIPSLRTADGGSPTKSNSAYTVLQVSKLHITMHNLNAWKTINFIEVASESQHHCTGETLKTV